MLFGTGYIFPALVAALVPIRSYLVYYMFSEEDLKFLDPFAETLTNLPGHGSEKKDDSKKKNMKKLKTMQTDLSATELTPMQVEEIEEV